MTRTLTIVGASVRAAAQSAVQAGFEVVAGDLFVDDDLAPLGQAMRIDDFPAGLARVIAGAQLGPWMYTGALENSPKLIAEMAGTRKLLGNDGEVLSRVRDPWLVAERLRIAGFRVPRVVPRNAAPSRDHSWLCKPLASASGKHIVSLADASNAAATERPHYFQEFIEGTSCSAVYVGSGDGVALLGATRQLIGESFCATSGFQYCGSVGPLSLPAADRETLLGIGRCLVSEFHLLGVFGVDFVWNNDGIWPVEVNPRYTASCELFDWACGISTVAMHVEACETKALPLLPVSNERLCGKAILYAPRRMVVGSEFAVGGSQMRLVGWPQIADIPPAGTVIDAHWPIVTVFAEGKSDDEVLVKLRERAAGVYRRLPLAPAAAPR